MTTKNASLSYQEIVSQPEAWEKTIERVIEHRSAIEALFRETRGRQTMMVACGSSYWGARSTALVLREAAGQPVETVTGGEFYVNAQNYYGAGDSLFVIVPSRSGQTGEIKKALEIAKERADIKLLSVVVYEQSAVGEMSDLSIALPWANEESVCQTKSFTSLIAAQAAVYRLAYGLPLGLLPAIPEAGRQLIERYEEKLRQLAADRSWSNLLAAGQGKAFGLACESALIMIEMSETQSNFYHTMEVAHGPNVVASSETLAIVFQSNHMLEHERRVIRDLRQRGAKVLVIGEPEAEREYECDHFVAIPGIEDEFERALVGLIVPQLLANFRAMEKGVNPDSPSDLNPWISIP
ncbi:SIS domain-containing protein [Paenibacillus montanisoli]|uniref:SIS domain-containing protein n=1 Tax=Paenibacillus montanisoli TaxID=2081970 RepID=A0A328U457_9BACL|nr:SIS domain-containing protein [Paenibacillus montanisoli]RAP74784.1 hypothetical protein DL346_22360 [Paenibacillus montanisoli]